MGQVRGRGWSLAAKGFAFYNVVSTLAFPILLAMQRELALEAMSKIEEAPYKLTQLGDPAHSAFAGFVNSSSTKELLAVIESGRATTLTITSEGGVIVEALILARAVRKARVTIIVNSYCASGCALIAAASPRLVAGNDAQLVFQRAKLLGVASPGTSWQVTDHANEEIASDLAASGLPDWALQWIRNSGSYRPTR